MIVCQNINIGVQTSRFTKEFKIPDFGIVRFLAKQKGLFSQKSRCSKSGFKHELGQITSCIDERG
jgi:hypothetical protein